MFPQTYGYRHKAKRRTKDSCAEIMDILLPQGPAFSSSYIERYLKTVLQTWPV